MSGLDAWVYLAIVLFLIVLAIVWILLPFAIFGTKPKLDALIDESRKTNAQLREIASLLGAFRPNTLSDPSAAVKAPAPAETHEGPLGTCPNCDNQIPLDSANCPKCEARFGPQSAWQVKPV
jgi:hypothetical protein